MKEKKIPVAAWCVFWKCIRHKCSKKQKRRKKTNIARLFKWKCRLHVYKAFFLSSLLPRLCDRGNKFCVRCSLDRFCHRVRHVLHCIWRISAPHRQILLQTKMKIKMPNELEDRIDEWQPNTRTPHGRCPSCARFGHHFCANESIPGRFFGHSARFVRSHVRAENKANRYKHQGQRKQHSSAIILLSERTPITRFILMFLFAARTAFTRRLFFPSFKSIVNSFSDILRCVRDVPRPIQMPNLVCCVRCNMPTGHLPDPFECETHTSYAPINILHNSTYSLSLSLSLSTWELHSNKIIMCFVRTTAILTEFPFIAEVRAVTILFSRALRQTSATADRFTIEKLNCTTIDDPLWTYVYVTLQYFFSKWFHILRDAKNRSVHFKILIAIRSFARTHSIHE